MFQILSTVLLQFILKLYREKRLKEHASMRLQIIFLCAFKIPTISSYYFYNEKKVSFTIKIPIFYSVKKEGSDHV